MRGMPLAAFHPAVRDWFAAALGAPTRPQALAWPVIARGDSALVVAPTGSGKTLAAFLACLDRLMFEAVPDAPDRCRVVYVSPLKALAVDVERNLRAPLAGVSSMAAFRSEPHHVPAVAVRTGDTPAAERRRFGRAPADILVTTPESLYLLLTSGARERLRAVDTVIVDEIHALAGTKRGAHLALSLERLQALARGGLQRIGLSATARPLDEVARFLGGAVPRPVPRARPTGAVADDVESIAGDEVRAEFEEPAGPIDYRPVTIVDAGAPKRLDLRIQRPAAAIEERPPGGGAAPLPARLLPLIEAHRSTLVFVNSRRVAERLAAAVNEAAGQPLALAHHGSIAPAQRRDIEERLKAGGVRALIATSSLELGIDMGAIDLVVQVEAPPSVASGLQRIGRGGHRVNAVSAGVVIPRYRGDLLACAAAARRMRLGDVEATRAPRNPLDVLAQQVVAMVAVEPWDAEALLGLVRRAAPYAALSRGAFEGVLDMLAGRYPSDDFAELRPRITWDRAAGLLTAREGARRVAIVNGGTIPDRGLYGVFLAGAPPGTARVGELDEEMVFESRPGEVFVLGASSWRIEEITHDRVLVSPAPGQPGKMPFWRGDRAGRPLDLGREIGRLARALRDAPAEDARARLTAEHALDADAADELLAYVAEQAAAGAVPDERTLVIERGRDELGDWRVCLLSPLGGRLHAPWAMAVQARVRRLRGLDVETLWADDGLVVRFPGSDEPPDPEWLLPPADEVEGLVLDELGGTALFAARFREAAARALLLPRRRPGGRAPLWQQRRRAADLLAVAARFGSFPMLLEAYRECLHDVFDLPALGATLRAREAGEIRTVTLDPARPSPFASAVLFGYVASFIYDGDAPLAERRAQALAVDQGQLRELLGDAELRSLLDPEVLAAVERQLQHLDERGRVRSLDGLHDLLLRLGDLSREEIARRAAGPEVVAGADALVDAGRAVVLAVAGEPRYVAVEDAARYRDALGAVLPARVPAALREPVRDPLGDLVHRHARTHGPFTTDELARRLGATRGAAEAALARQAAAGRLLQGEFRPGGREREWCAPEVLDTVRRRSLAKARRAVEPVEPAALGRLVTAWQGLDRPRAGLDALLDVVEALQGAPLPASIVETDVLPARIEGYRPGDLDALAAAGEVVWCGLEPLGERDGRLALYLTDAMARLWRPPGERELTPLERRVVAHLQQAGACFFPALHQGLGGGFAADLVEALWSLVWKGVVTSDTFHALRARLEAPGRAERRGRRARRPFRSRRATPPAAEGRWALTAARLGAVASATEWSAAVAQQLLARYGIVTRESVAADHVPGGFPALYEVFRALEDAGRLRRGYFVRGVGAAQFALPAALERLRALRDAPETPQTVRVAAADPANPYGALLPWPEAAAGRAPARAAGAAVVLVDGACAAWLARGGRALTVWLPDDAPARATVAHAVARELAALAAAGRPGGLLVSEIDGVPADRHPLAPVLVEHGFAASGLGLSVRRGAAARG
jgi:ATP-dependent Lhr-like helicase